MVTIADARLVARNWVAGQAGPELVGAFLAGSAAVGSGAAELAATSDVDLIMVTAGAAPAKVGKLWHDGVLLDVSSLSSAELDPETIAGTSYLAPFFTDSMIIHDPSGVLATLHDRVRELVDQPLWIRRRVAEVRTKITDGLAAPRPDGSPAPAGDRLGVHRQSADGAAAGGGGPATDRGGSATCGAGSC